MDYATVLEDSFEVNAARRRDIDVQRQRASVHHPRVGCVILLASWDGLLELERDGQRKPDLDGHRSRAWESKGWTDSGNAAVQSYVRACRRIAKQGGFGDEPQAVHELVQRSTGYRLRLRRRNVPFTGTTASAVAAHLAGVPWFGSGATANRGAFYRVRSKDYAAALDVALNRPRLTSS